MLAPNHSDIASAKDGSISSAVFQALVVQMPVLVHIVSSHSMSDLLNEVFRWTCERWFLLPLCHYILVFFIRLFCDPVLDFWCLLIPTGLYMLIPHCKSFRRHHRISYRFPEWVEFFLELGLIKITICSESFLLPRACYACRCYVLNDVVHIGLVVIFGCVSVPIPATKLLM